MISKSELRKQLLNKRKNLNTKVLSNLICKKIIDLKQYKTAKNIFAYYPKTYEVDISPLFEDNEKNWFLPKVIGNEMTFIEYHLGDNLIKSEFGVSEPEGEKTLINPDLIIVPALSADKKGYRLGYGKGFYDRFLENQICPTISPVFAELLLNELPIEKHDIKIDIIVS